MGCQDGKDYVCEAIDAPDAPGAFRVDEGEEEKGEDEEVDLPVEDDSDPGFSPKHPKNLKFVHEITVHPANLPTKEFKDFVTTQELCQHNVKYLKLVKCFSGKEGENPHAFMNTYRNGFISACAMAHNFHLPLVLCPNDIWLVVLQGLKIHFGRNAAKDFMG